MKISVFIAQSLDGFIARENGDLDWLTSDDAQDDNNDYGYQNFMDSIDYLVMGRKTYEKVLSFGEWPYKDKHVVVLSHNPIRIPTDLTNKVELQSGSLQKIVNHLEKTGAKHIYVDGGKTISAFLNARLIDDMIITRIPVFLGSGIPLFSSEDKETNLQHIETQKFPNGFVQTKYLIIHK